MALKPKILFLLVVDKYYLSGVVCHAETFFMVLRLKREKNHPDITEGAAMLSAGSRNETSFLIYSDW